MNFINPFNLNEHLFLYEDALKTASGDPRFKKNKFCLQNIDRRR